MDYKKPYGRYQLQVFLFLNLGFLLPSWLSTPGLMGSSWLSFWVPEIIYLHYHVCLKYTLKFKGPVSFISVDSVSSSYQWHRDIVIGFSHTCTKSMDPHFKFHIQKENNRWVKFASFRSLGFHNWVSKLFHYCPLVLSPLESKRLDLMDSTFNFLFLLLLAFKGRKTDSKLEGLDVLSHF